MATKAARGAGFDWGMADEAARATCWLAARDLPGPEALADLLDQLDGKTLSDFAPVTGGGEWTASGSGWLCPVATGAAMLDRAAALTGVAASRLDRRCAPFWCGQRLRRFGRAVRNRGAARSDQYMRADAVSVHRRSWHAPPTADQPRAGTAVPSGTAYPRTPQRTYAPATEASRLAGAGAGLSDND